MQNNNKTVYEQMLEDMFKSILTLESKELYNRVIDKPIILVQEKSHDVQKNYSVSSFNFSFACEFVDNIDTDISIHIINLAKCFNYLVENGFIDYGIHLPISLYYSYYGNQHKLNKIVISFSVFTSKYLNVRITAADKKSKYKNVYEALNKITKLHYWHDSISNVEKDNWESLKKVLKNK